MSEFIPPYPHRLPEEPNAWQRFKLGRRNLLGAWSEDAFSYDLVSAKIFASTIVICNTPESVQYAFSTRNQSFERKSPTVRHMIGPLVGDGVFISEGPTWRKRRRLVSPIIHVSRLAEFAPVMTETACEAATAWGERPDGAVIDVIAEMAHLTAEIICRTVFGRKLGHERGQEIIKAFNEFQTVASLVDWPSLFGLPEWMPRLKHPAVYRTTGLIKRVVDEIIASYRSRENPADVSVISRLIDARDQETGEQLSNEALRNEAVVLFMAGYETTASTLSFVWFLISQVADVEARLHEELDSVLGGRPPTLADVPKLLYTRAIIEETLRLYPPIPILAREALADDEIEGQRVPKGAILMVVPFLLHRKKGLWERPDHFVPDRFLPGGSGAPSRWAYVPFSTGPRNCAGMAFASTEAVLCVATLAQRFSLRLRVGHRVEPICRVSLRPGDHLPMTLHRRTAARRPAAAAPAEAVTGCPFEHG